MAAWPREQRRASGLMAWSTLEPANSFSIKSAGSGGCWLLAWCTSFIFMLLKMERIYQMSKLIVIEWNKYWQKTQTHTSHCKQHQQLIFWWKDACSPLKNTNQKVTVDCVKALGEREHHGYEINHIFIKIGGKFTDSCHAIDHHKSYQAKFHDFSILISLQGSRPNKS